MTNSNLSPANHSAPLFALPVNEYVSLINSFLNAAGIELEEAEALIINGIEVPTQVEFSKNTDALKIQGTVTATVSKDAQFVEYEIWQSIETKVFALQLEQARDTETVSLYAFDQASSLELKLVQTENKIMQITITDLAKPDNPLCQLVRDTEFQNGILPMFKTKI